MNWFVVAPHYEDAGVALPWIDARLIDEKGSQLETADAPVRQSEVRVALDVRSAGVARLRSGRAVRTGHVLNYSLRSTLTISGELNAGLLDAGIVLDPAIYRWKLTVEGTARGSPREYRILWPLHVREVLDIARSTVTYYPNTSVIKMVHKWVVDAARLPTSDIFPTGHGRMIISERARAVFERFRPLGAIFRECSVYAVPR